ncbi:MAG: glycoside hydrolase family 28 protein [Terriglobia bacterium]
MMLRRNFLRNSGTLGLAASTPVLGAGTASGAPLRPAVHNVLQYGAAGDGKRKDTRAILAAIGACAKSGGGTVFFPSGKYLTGAIELQSDLDLHLDSGAMLLGSDDPADYPVYSSAWPDGSKIISSLIYGDRLNHVSVTGRGTIDGQGKAWWVREWLASPRHRVRIPAMSDAARAAETANVRYGRPRLIHFSNCTDVLIEGLTLTNSPFWTVHPMFCEYVTISGVTILNPVPSPNTDGIDPESSREVHISDCHIDVGDDCIAIKSGKDALGRQVGRPCENITITNLTTVHGHAGVAIGSEMSGGVRNISISNCVFQGTDRGIRIKTQRGRGGVVEGVAASNIVMQEVAEPVTITAFYSRGDVNSIEPVSEGTPVLRNVSLSNIMARGAKSAGQITGLRELPVSDVTLSRVELAAERGFSCQNARRIAFHDARIECRGGPALVARNVQGLQLDGVCPSGSSAGTPLVDAENVQDVFARGCSSSGAGSAFLRVSGAQSSGIVLRANNLGRPGDAVLFANGADPKILSRD